MRSVGADAKGPRAASEEGGKGKEPDNPPEDAVWGLDIIRENPTIVRSDPTAVYKVCLYTILIKLHITVIVQTYSFMSLFDHRPKRSCGGKICLRLVVGYILV